MKRTSRIPARAAATIATAVCLLALAAVVPADVRSADQSDGEFGRESLEHWQFFQVVELSATGDSPWSDFVLGPSVFDKARLDLGDARLYDGAGKEVPYALRIRRAESESQVVPAREFNRAVAPDGSTELSLDIGDSPLEHNQVEVATPGMNYRRRAQLEGSDDGQQWLKLVEQAYLFHFQSGQRDIEQRRLSYAGSRFRYLRVRVYRDVEIDREPAELSSVTVRRTVDVPGELVILPAKLGGREPVPADGGPGSAWTIELGGDYVPCERLLVRVADAEFVRNYHVEAAGPPGSDRPFQWVSKGAEWRRRAGEKAAPLEAKFGEVTASRLKLVVTDHRNPPLGIASAEFSAAARQIVFARAAAEKPPLRLYFGNPNAIPPNYDFARQLPPKLDPSPTRLTLGPRTLNPQYRPPALPLTERWPWLIYAVLGSAAALLAAIIGHLARTAIRLHDAQTNQGQTAESSG